MLPNHEVLKQQLSAMPGRRENYGVLIHSLPRETGRTGLRRLINELKKDVQHIFVTDRREEVYREFPKIWEDFLDLLW